MALNGERAAILEGMVGGIRGGAEWAALYPGNRFTIEVCIEEDNLISYEYAITVETRPQAEIVEESLVKVIHSGKNDLEKTNIFIASRPGEGSLLLVCNIYNGKGRPVRKDVKKAISAISQLKNYELKPEVLTAMNTVTDKIEQIFILDPIPSLMRDYQPFSSQLARNASNLAGMIAALPPETKAKMESLLSKYVARLPEGEVKRVWTEPVGKFQKDAMLYCEEKWSNTGETLTIDARGMSDGTLRFLGILTALLTCPEGTLIVIEEVDNGLHPSRAKLLVQILREIGRERGIDILITTHNSALMDELGIEMIPFVQVVHRDHIKGYSKITLLEDIKNLPNDKRGCGLLL